MTHGRRRLQLAVVQRGQEWSWSAESPRGQQKPPSRPSGQRQGGGEHGLNTLCRLRNARLGKTITDKESKQRKEKNAPNHTIYHALVEKARVEPTKRHKQPALAPSNEKARGRRRRRSSLQSTVGQMFEKKDGSCFSAKQVYDIHGFLSTTEVKELAETTNYNERDIYILFNRFKALCGLSSTPIGIDKDTFRKGVPMLSVEDDLFVDRVFEVLDEDGSGVIEWEEFIEAMSSLEKGSREKRTEFLFRVYDIDKDGGITRDELSQFFTSSLLVKPDPNIRELSEYFVDQVFAELDQNGDGFMTMSEALKFIETHPEVTDIYGLFGRSMTSDKMDTFGGGDFLVQRQTAEAQRKAQHEAKLRRRSSTSFKKKRTELIRTTPSPTLNKK